MLITLVRFLSITSSNVRTVSVSQRRYYHDDVIKWKHFSPYWPFVRGIHRLAVISPRQGQWRRALVLSLICALNKRLSKQSLGWWFETPTCSLRRHCNDIDKVCSHWRRLLSSAVRWYREIPLRSGQKPWQFPWWRHQMETVSALLAICAGNSPVPGEFPAQRWFATLSCPLWRHCNAAMILAWFVLIYIWISHDIIFAWLWKSQYPYIDRSPLFFPSLSPSTPSLRQIRSFVGCLWVSQDDYK